MKYKLPHIPGIEIEEGELLPVIIGLAIVLGLLILVAVKKGWL